MSVCMCVGGWVCSSVAATLSQQVKTHQICEELTGT